MCSHHLGAAAIGLHTTANHVITSGPFVVALSHPDFTSNQIGSAITKIGLETFWGAVRILARSPALERLTRLRSTRPWR